MINCPDQLPHWLLDAWHATAATITDRQIDGPEPPPAAA